MARLRRSLLFVPGAEPRKIERSRETGADALIFDLEDSVAPEQKDRAREQIAAALAAGGFGESELVVRVNPVDSEAFAADLEAAVGAGAHCLLVPKADSREPLARVAARLDALGSLAARVKLLALVESAAGITRAAELGGPRVEALCFGHADFLLDMGLAAADARDGVAFHARCALAIAARAARVAAIDTVCLAVRDAAAFREDALLGARLGFEGKLCIHPGQVPIAHEVYTPTPEQVDQALRVVAAWEEARAQGRGVLVLDSKMIDAPLVGIQQRVLERARQAGVLPGSSAA